MVLYLTYLPTQVFSRSSFPVPVSGNTEPQTPLTILDYKKEIKDGEPVLPGNTQFSHH